LCIKPSREAVSQLREVPLDVEQLLEVLGVENGPANGQDTRGTIQLGALTPAARHAIICSPENIYVDNLREGPGILQRA
jgi:hypothetical protein